MTYIKQRPPSLSISLVKRLPSFSQSSSVESIDRSWSNKSLSIRWWLAILAHLFDLPISVYVVSPPPSSGWCRDLMRQLPISQSKAYPVTDLAPLAVECSPRSFLLLASALCSSAQSFNSLIGGALSYASSIFLSPFFMSVIHHQVL